MIDSYDIRAGNRVLLNSSAVTVTILKVEKSAILLDTFPQNSYCLNTDLSGIPLTTDMLRKLSFENDAANIWVGEGITVRRERDGYYYGLRISKNRAKMQYLHQLQNYITDFYALFREKDYCLDISLLK